MLLRHAEKPQGDGAPHGVTIDGDMDPESLTPRGWQRAGALIRLFVPGPADSGQASLPTPTHLFASQIVGNGSKRPRETLQPLAERLGLEVDARFAKDDVGPLVDAVRAIDGVVLVAWEHRRIPPIANLLLGDAADVPQVWPDDRFDVVWVFDVVGPGRMRFREVPEMLLAGDRPAPIGPAGPPPSS